MDVNKTLFVDDTLHAFVETELLPGTGVAPAAFWAALERILADFAPPTPPCWPGGTSCRRRSTPGGGAGAARRSTWPRRPPSCKEIGYLLAGAGAISRSDATNVDPEIATIAGPQLVVPVSNGRYALNAANARWGSLYDALYGTDALEPPTGDEGL